ncbi:transmembrane signal receptor [Lithospermum erythrorhizon]|uniref:Transmembrane signal receptor n=1 Tax=Lithospermum erythrorhizon TaxID=34254 RepID=A0AAV3RP03_LITER
MRSTLLFAEGQYIRHNLSRLVLAAWLCVIIVVAACFTAVLSSMMTVKGLHPLITDFNTNTHVGCNERSFIVQYLKSDLGFPSSNVEEFQSLDQYPEAFKKGKIEAAFLSAPHAKVFLAKYCNEYAMAGPSWKLGGMGYVFQKNSNLEKDISEAILNITEKGEIDRLQNEMISSFNCSSLTGQGGDLSLGIRPFSGLLIISSTICGIVFISALFRILEQHYSIYGFLQSFLINLRVCIWVSRLLSQFYSTNGFTFFRRPSSISIERTDVQMSTVHGHDGGHISTI